MEHEELHQARLSDVDIQSVNAFLRRFVKQSLQYMSQDSHNGEQEETMGWRKPTDRRGKSARVDLSPRVFDSEFEALVDIHAARRIACEPVVLMSLDSVTEAAETHLASLIIADQSPTIEAGKDEEGKDRIMRPSHA